MRCTSLLAVFLAVAVSAEEVPPDLERAAGVLLANEIAEADYATCPGSLWNTRKKNWIAQAIEGEYSVSYCTEFPLNCASVCVERSNAQACLSLANALDNFDVPNVDQASRYGYAMACALGEPSGCTNRAAGLRNVPADYDALSLGSFDDRAACFAPGFAAACAAGDAWGCAMDGQAHLYGEAVQQDDAVARERLNKACAISQETVADDSVRAPCRYARSLLSQIDG